MQVVEEAVSEEVDISVPYDAAAKLAYEASDKSMAYDDFKVKYEADAVADVISKQAPKEEEIKAEDVVVEEDSPSEEVDISVPYDAAAKIAYEASDKSMAFVDFKEKFVIDAIADVIAKQAKEEAATR